MIPGDYDHNPPKVVMRCRLCGITLTSKTPFECKKSRHVVYGFTPKGMRHVARHEWVTSIP